MESIHLKLVWLWRVLELVLTLAMVCTEEKRLTEHTQYEQFLLYILASLNDCINGVTSEDVRYFRLITLR